MAIEILARLTFDEWKALPLSFWQELPPRNYYLAEVEPSLWDRLRGRPQRLELCAFGSSDTPSVPYDMVADKLPTLIF